MSSDPITRYNSSMIVALTGHRPNKIPDPDQIERQIRTKLEELGPTRVITGMALGVDQWAAQICVDLGIPFLAAIPFRGQDSFWSIEAREEYLELLGLASEVVVVSEGGFDNAKFQLRNEWMVDRADVLIAVWDGSSGGTRNCVRYAELMKKPIHRIIPITR